MKQYYSYNDGETTDESLWEIIQYLVDSELAKDEIIGTELDICEPTKVYSDKEYCKIQNILYEGIELMEDTYFEDKIVEILKKIEAVEYLGCVDRYTITEQDWEDFNK